MFWDDVLVHRHAMNAGFDVPCLDRYFSRPFKVYAINLRLRNMRLRVFVCVSQPNYRGDTPRVDFIIFKKGANEDSLGSILSRDMDIVRDSAERYAHTVMVGLFMQLYLTWDRLKHHFPRGHWHSRPLHSLCDGIHVVSNL